MKKLLLALSVTGCLLFSVSVLPVRADEGDGHDAGYVCVETETVHCPPDGAAPTGEGETSASNVEKAEDTPLTLLELVIKLILES